MIRFLRQHPDVRDALKREIDELFADLAVAQCEGADPVTLAAEHMRARWAVIEPEEVDRE